MSQEILALAWLGGVLVLSLVPIAWLLGRLVRKLEPEKRRDAYLGFFGALVLNLCVILVILALDRLRLDWDETPGWLLTGIGLLRLGLPWVANLVPLVFFAKVRYQIALGAIGFFGFLLAWAILAGSLFLASCLVVVSLVLLVGR